MLEAEKEATAEKAAAGSMRTFLLLWFGQMVSVLGSSLTNFGIGVWVYQKTGSATQFALMMMAISIPGILVAPFAGALVDRWDRRIALLVSEGGAGLSSLALAALALSGHLQVWQIYLILMVSSSFATLAWPAMSAVVTLLVPKQHLSRANSMLLLNEALSGILGPAIGGFAMVAGVLAALVMADVASFAVSVLVLLSVRVPKPVKTAANQPQQSLMKDAVFGWGYVKERPGLLGLMFFFMGINFLLCTCTALFTPMALSLYKADIVGRIASCQGIGMICGTVLMAIWGGPKKRVYGVVGVGVLFGLTLMMMALPPTVILLSGVIFTLLLWAPIMNTSSQSIWQVKVAPDIQGRVFAIRRVGAQLMAPLAFAISGPLADKVFTPGMASGGALSQALGPVFGTGPDAGIRVIIVLMGSLTVLFSAAMFFNHRIRNLETELPDHVR